MVFSLGTLNGRDGRHCFEFDYRKLIKSGVSKIKKFPLTTQTDGSKWIGRERVRLG